MGEPLYCDHNRNSLLRPWGDLCIATIMKTQYCNGNGTHFSILIWNSMAKHIHHARNLSTCRSRERSTLCPTFLTVKVVGVMNVFAIVLSETNVDPFVIFSILVWNRSAKHIDHARNLSTCRSNGRNTLCPAFLAPCSWFLPMWTLFGPTCLFMDPTPW